MVHIHLYQSNRRKMLVLLLALSLYIFSSAQSTIFSPSTVPAVPAETDGAAIETGVKFRVTQAGFITGVRFYKGALNTGTHIGHLWSSTGTKLAEITFTGESASGWQQMSFTTPVAVAINTTYVASYFSSSGYYAYTNPFFTTATVNGPLTALANGTDGGNGVYIYSAASAFPNNTYQTSNYWVDVVYTTSIGPDVTAPAVNITAPVAGNVSGTINVTANATDNVGVAGVQFLLNGVNLGAEDIASPFTISWNTTTSLNGPYTLTAIARDAAGNTTTSAGVAVTINNDTQAPTVSMTAPAAGNVTGAVSVTATAADNVAVAGVQFLLDGTSLGAEDVSSPYSISWNTATATNGNHTLTARARDAAGNTTVSAGVVVTVNNDTQAPTVSITAPAAGQVAGTINVDANAADNVGVVGVQFLLDGVALGAEDVLAPYSVSWNTTTIADGNHTLTARARDAAGNITTSAGVIVAVKNDTQGPVVNITAPIAGDVSGTVNVTAGATDNIGVVGVQFLLNGANLGTEDVAAPYSVSWNTIGLTNGNYTLTARGRDASGNTTTSAAVIVNVNNAPDAQGPVVTLTAPVAGTVSGTVTPTATATDNIGVVGVQFLLNGANLGAEDLTSPYSISWNTTTVANGTYTLTARARDAAGNSTTSAGVVVTVNNVTLIAALPMNEGAGTTTADISGNNHPGTLTATPVWGAGKYGQGLTFNGTSSYVNIPDHNDFTLDPTQNYTWSGWVKNTSFKEWSTVWSQTLNNSTFFYFYAHTTTDVDGGPVTAGISVYWWVGANRVGVHSSNNVLTVGQWSYVAVTYDASLAQNNRFTIYVNGVDVTVRTDVSTSGTLASINPTNIRIGSNQPFGEYLNGSVDEVRFYKKLLSLAEVQADMNTPMAPDAAAPTVSITAPLAGNVAGTINVTANASDNVGVAGVQFLLDGVNLGAEDLVAPYSISWNTITATNGNHTLTARARDGAGNLATSADVIVTVNNDAQAPVVGITAPVAGPVSGTINVDANATDNVSVVGVQFLLDGVNLSTEDLVAPYSVSWNTATVIDGNHTLTARARDAAGNITTSAAVIVAVGNDGEAPAVSITAPAAGNVAGTINVTANASDNVGVVGVQFLLNGANLGAEDLVAPYSVSWITTSVANGNYTLTARARDAAGNITTSTAVVVTVNNDTQAPTVSITAPVAGAVSGTINVDANAADNIGVAGVQFLLDGVALGAEDILAPFSVSWNTTTTTDGNHTLTARARDAVGNTTTSAGVIVNVHNDTQAPTVSITAPAAGSVTGTISVTATASDNVGVAGVQFLLNGANLGTEDLVAPYSISWNSQTVANGTYTLTARARDAGGNTTTSAGVIVTVTNNSTLIAALNLNEGSGTSAADISGNSHHGTLINAPTWGAGKYGQGLTFNGTSSYVNIPSHSDFILTPTQSYTWSAWVKNTSFKEWSTVWSQTVDANNFFYFYAHTTTDVDGGPVTNGISAYWWNNGGTNRVGVHSSNNVLTVGQWSYVTVVYDASLVQNNRFTIFVNGVDVTVRTDVSSSGTLAAINTTNIRVGSNAPFGEYLNGAVDEIRIYKRALTAAEVQADMNLPIASGIAPTVAPVNGATSVSLNATITAVFNVDMNASTINSSTIELRDGSNALVASTITYNSGTRTATLTPSSALLSSTIYSAKIIGGASGVKDSGGNAMSGDYNWSFTTADPVVIAPTEGPGGPILVISTTTNPFSRYAVEILRTEGLNEFAAADISTVTAGVLNNYDVVILGEMTVTAAQVTMFTNWVNAGGTLIAFRPSALLTPLLGISTAGGTLADKYLLVNTASGPGTGIVNQTIQFHSTANLHTLNGAISLATLYSTATTATTNPAVTMISVGSNGGRAVAFTYDLARSIVYTRQGNPAWAGQKRDGQIDPIRSDDMFFPDWIDFNKIAIPQADEQQRLLANIILQSNLHRKPLPRFWYLPRDLKAAIVMSGDDHANNGTPGRFDQYLTLGPNTAQDVADWKAVRGTSYMYPGTAITNAQAVSYQAQGFEIALHPNTGCINYTEASLLSTFNTQLGQFTSAYPGVTSPVTNRTHCLAWSDWASQPKVELQKGMRYDVTYYNWPEVWMQNRPGMFTGSGMPMRFADLDGSLIDVYQSVTQMTDETNMNYTTFCNAVLDKAIGSEGYYGVFTTNMHTDNASSAGSDAIVASAQARQIPIVSSKQMLTWLDGRNNSYFSNMTWTNNQLTFAVIARSTANNLKAMLPLNSENGTLISITRNGNSVAFTTQTIKGIQYAFFAPVTGTNTYIATYSSSARMATPPITEVTTATEPVKTITEESKTITPDSKLYVNVMPNPSINYFNVVIHSNDATPVKIRVMDMFGRVLETHDKVTSASILRIGQTWPSGTYFAEVIQGNQRQIVKFIKAN
jgi:hypothetical protein